MKYNDKEVVYIKYHNNKPHSVIVAELGKWSVDNYDFETDCKECELFMHYNSGSGGLATEIQAPTYIDGCEDTCKYWLHPQAKLKGLPKNIRKIDNPIEINGSINPFDNSREVFQTIYCKICDAYLDEDWCEHLTEDDDGNICYTNGDKHE
jgi:hypothetical protein